jgi:hypothetical protein
MGSDSKRRKPAEPPLRLILFSVLSVLLILFFVHDTPIITGPPAVVPPAVVPPHASCLAVGWGDERYIPPPSDHFRCLLSAPKSPIIKIIESVVVGMPRGGRCGTSVDSCPLSKIKPYDENLRRFGEDWPPFGYTMVGKTRLDNMEAAVSEVIAQKVQGDIVELGVWRGGVMIIAAAVLHDLGEQRNLRLFDAFEQIPGYGSASNFLAVSEAEVRAAFDDFGLQGPHIHFHPGLFKNTVPLWDVSNPIAVLRIDGNFYDSYQDALYYLYESVTVGGIVIFDDVMSHNDVMRCWNDFKREQGLVENLNQVRT